MAPPRKREAPTPPKEPLTIDLTQKPLSTQFNARAFHPMADVRPEIRGALGSWFRNPSDARSRRPDRITSLYDQASDIWRNYPGGLPGRLEEIQKRKKQGPDRLASNKSVVDVTNPLSLHKPVLSYDTNVISPRSSPATGDPVGVYSGQSWKNANKRGEKPFGIVAIAPKTHPEIPVRAPTSQRRRDATGYEEVYHTAQEGLTDPRYPYIVRPTERWAKFRKILADKASQRYAPNIMNAQVADDIQREVNSKTNAARSYMVANPAKFNTPTKKSNYLHSQINAATQAAKSRIQSKVKPVGNTKPWTTRDSENLYQDMLHGRKIDPNLDWPMHMWLKSADGQQWLKDPKNKADVIYFFDTQVQNEPREKPGLFTGQRPMYA